MMIKGNRNGFGNDKQVVLMLHMDGTNGGTTFTDSAYGGRSAKTIDVSGGSQTSTITYKFAPSSALFDGTGDWISSANSTDWNISAGDWTIDFWGYFASDRLYHIPFGRERATAPYPGYYLYYTISDGVVYWITDNNTNRITTASSSLATDGWHHLALVCFNGVTTLYIDGVSKGSYTGNPQEEAIALYIGADPTTFTMKGYIDEFRFTKGIARWVRNFDVPARAY